MKKLIPFRMVTKPPPPFLRARVIEIDPVTPRMTMVTFEGDGLGSLVPDDPGASVRLLTPRQHAADEPEMPTYDGNVFRYDDGELSTARTMTPLSAGRTDRIRLGVHDHGSGRLSTWLGEVQPGNVAAIAGPGPAYEVDRSATRFIVAGDESAIPAISQLLTAIPDNCDVEVCIEVAAADARTALPAHPRAAITWQDRPPAVPPSSTLVTWMAGRAIDDETRVWVAGEAAAIHKIRKLDGIDGRPRSQANVRGYWKLRPETSDS